MLEKSRVGAVSSPAFGKDPLPMTPEPIQRWLERKKTRHIAGCWGGALLALSAGIFVLFLTFLLAYIVLLIGEEGISAVMGFFGNREFHLSHGWRLVISWLFVTALCVEWVRRSPWDLGDYDKTNTTPGARALVPFFGASSLLLVNAQASATIITEILYLGPRLVLGALSLAREAYRSRKLATAECARILQLLVSRENAVTYEEFRTVQPEADWATLKNSLARIPGVVFLEKGLSLTDDLRKELGSVRSVN
jgi:hypothetical protein